MAPHTWIVEEDIRAIHKEQVDEHGGTEGIRDYTVLGSVLKRPKEIFAYKIPHPDVAALAAAYAMDIVKNRPFVARNKRTAAAVARRFLNSNKTDLLADDIEMLPILSDIRAGTVSENDLAEWIRNHLDRTDSAPVAQTPVYWLGSGPRSFPTPPLNASYFRLPDWTPARLSRLAAIGREMRAGATARVTRAIRLTRVQIYRSIRSSRKFARRARVTALLRLFWTQEATARAGRRAFTSAVPWSATIVALLIFLLFVAIVQDPTELKTSEVHLTCAQVIGAALALILSLSIIPAQRAAEAFSPAILRLYAQDHGLVGAFLILSLATTGSVLLGTNFFPRMDPRLSIGIQFLLLGVSFDALRMFHGWALDLLIPQTAIQLVIRKCTKLLNTVSGSVGKLARLQALSIGESAPTDASRAILFSASQVSTPLRFWIGQLDEIAHKLIARRDTTAANDIVTAMGWIGTQYSEARRNSLILVPDFDNLFAGGVSDINEVLNPIYESVRVICEDAAKSSNEIVVRHCVQIVASMTTHAMTMIHSSDDRWRKAPLAFSPCYWLGLCTTVAIKWNMGDAALAAVRGFQTILLNQKKDVDTTDLEAQSLESLLMLAKASYIKPDAVWGFPAIQAMLLAARHDIEMHGYSNRSTLKAVLESVRPLAPLEIAMEKAGKRTLQVFPPYHVSFEASIPALLEMVAHQVRVDAERPFNNPFDEFLEAAEDVRNHYLELSTTDFENTLARKWVVESLIMVAWVHWTLLMQPPAGSENHLDGVEESLRSLISLVPSLFPETTEPHRFHATEAADSLACLGISMLEHGWIKTAQSCASIIGALAINSAALRPDPYVLADLHQRLEVLARAAVALGRLQAAIDIRAVIQRPATVSDDHWPHFLEARQTRLSQLDRSLRERQRPSRLRDDPIWELQRLLNRGACTS
jgi:death-on-curing family protein